MASNLFKKGSDNLLNGTIMGAGLGALVASTNIPWIQSIVSGVMGVIPTTWLTWAGAFGSLVVFGLIGAIAGYIIDSY